MPLEKSEAVILRMFNWSESSRTVSFFTRDFGKLALVDRGGRRMATKRGRLQPFARMELTFYRSERTTSGYISDCELIRAYSFEREGTLGRLAYGSAACELLYLLLPDEQAQTGLYSYLTTFLAKTCEVEKRFLPALFAAFFLRLMSQIGFRPSLAHCSGCGKELSRLSEENSHVWFAPERGGLVCKTCQKPGEHYIPLSADGARLLATLQRASLEEAASLPIGYQDAALLTEALTKFLKYHSGLVSDLRSLAFLEKLRKSQLNG